ncbi:16907_t:CDS:2 [Funneliformis caledonium]|uniref:16907_t:CDS:1 n=1 Tax=Funneliformis caledonium TaxID=1117310 RepID=A0A9N8YU17_9GLOM|nr:16907_t:CDS:2 [Funneliformis caledonium]
MKDGIKRGSAIKLNKQARIFKERVKVISQEGQNRNISDSFYATYSLFNDLNTSQEFIQVNGKKVRKPLDDIFNNISLQNDRFIDILEGLKIAIRDFDQSIIVLDSSRLYKSSNHMYVNSEHYLKVPSESIYDAKIY